MENGTLESRNISDSYHFIQAIDKCHTLAIYLFNNTLDTFLLTIILASDKITEDH